MPPELDAELASTMTPEELEAINAEASPEEGLIMRQPPEGESDDDADEDGEEGEEADAAAPAPAPSSAPAPAPEPAQAEAPAPAPTKAPAQDLYQAELPSDYEERIGNLKARDAELRQRFKDGEIDIDERDAGLAEVQEEREALLVARTKADISQDMSAQAAQRAWRDAITESKAKFALPENGGIDYDKDAEAAEAWNEEVKALAQMPRHADKSMEWFLTTAHKRVMLERGLTPAASLTPAPAPAPAASRKPPIGQAPVTLAQVPGSDGPGDVGGEFAHLSALNGEELEDAIARMSPAQREKYARGL